VPGHSMRRCSTRRRASVVPGGIFSEGRSGQPLPAVPLVRSRLRRSHATGLPRRRHRGGGGRPAAAGRAVRVRRLAAGRCRLVDRDVPRHPACLVHGQRGEPSGDRAADQRGRGEDSCHPHRVLGQRCGRFPAACSGYLRCSSGRAAHIDQTFRLDVPAAAGCRVGGSRSALPASPEARCARRTRSGLGEPLATRGRRPRARPPRRVARPTSRPGPGPAPARATRGRARPGGRGRGPPL
jgi:hypothetical protein